MFFNFVLILWLLTIPYAIFFHVINKPFLSLIIGIISILFTTCYFLNKQGNGLISRLSFILIVNVALIFFSFDFPFAGFQYILFALLPVTLIFFEQKNVNIQIILMILQGISFIGLEWMIFKLTHTLPTNIEKKLYYSILINCFLIIICSFIFHRNISNHYRFILSNLLKAYGVTERELEIISYIIDAKSNKEISSQLYIEESTVKKHISNIFSKLNVKSRVQLISKVTVN